MTAHPGDADLPYLEAQFVQLEQLAAAHGWPARALRAAIRAAQMPAPSYRLADGRELLPADYFAPAEMAARAQRLGNWFAEAYARAARGQADADPLPVAWRDYLSGGYGVCLRSVTPSTIVRKTVLVAQLERLLADPKPGDGAWLAELRTAVDALD